VFFSLVLDEIKPHYYKRIYYADNNLWNFNPTLKSSAFKRNCEMGLKNPKVMSMRETECVEKFNSLIKDYLLPKKCTINSLSPDVPHHMVTLKLGKKNGIPVSIVHSLSSKGHTPPYYTKTNTGTLSTYKLKTHYSSNMIMPDNYLNELPYTINHNYPYQETFRNELGRLGSILALMGNETKYYIPNTKLAQYDLHTINYDYAKYCTNENIEMWSYLDSALKETIHEPGNLLLWKSMTVKERYQFEAVTVVD